MFHFTGFKYKIGTIQKIFLAGVAVLYMISSLNAQASTIFSEKHVHTGSSTLGDGCYTQPVCHEHSGSNEAGGGCYLTAVGHAHEGSSIGGYGCYTVPIYHTHSGSSTAGGACYRQAVYHVHSGSGESQGGCYRDPVYHVHSGSSTSGQGCYAAPVYHAHSGSGASGGGCYTIPFYHSHVGDSTLGGECYGTPVFHRHQGRPGQIYANGCYTLETTEGVAVFCGLFEKQENGIWQCNQCGELTIDGNVPYNRHHSPITPTTVYVLGCGKSESTPERYELNCGKDTNNIEYYTLGCGKDKTTVEIYASNCGKDENTVESYALSCEKDENIIESYALSCGMDVNTVEQYTLGCGKEEGQTDHYALSCGKDAGQTEYYVLGCGKEESTVEKYYMACDKEEQQSSVAPDPEDSSPISYIENELETQAPPVVQEEVVQPVKVEMESFAKEEEPLESTESIRQTVVYQPVSQEGPWESWMFVAGAVAVVLVAVLVGVYFLWSQIALLYCYDSNREYKLLGILTVHKNQQNYKVRIERRIWARAAVNRYRLALNRRLQKKAMDLPLVIETEEQNLVLPLEEFVDFAL